MYKKIFIASDHAGYDLKGILDKHLRDQQHEVVDVGAHTLNPADDYPDYMLPLAKRIASEPGTFGIAIGGSGEGEAMAANRVGGVRAAEYYGGNLDILKLSREHNNANILSLGARFISPDEAKAAVDLWLNTDFSNDERHVRRIEKLDN